MNPRTLLALSTLAASASIMPTAAHAAEITVMSSVAIKDAYLELVPAFEQASGYKVVTLWAPTVEMMTRLKTDEPVDLVLMAIGNVEELIKLGKLAAGTRVDIVRSGIGVAIRKGAARPDIATAAGLQATLLAAPSISYSTGPSGVYLVGLFERMGIADAIKPKIRQVQGVPVAELVARGEVAIGFQQISEILPVAGAELAGPLPAEVQSITTFAAALRPGARHAEAAQAWVKFLTAPAAAAVIRKHGLEPAAG